MKEIDISTDLDSVKESIIHFIANYIEERGFEGALVWFSGYIDSTIITKLTIEALGENVVKILIRSEKYTNDHKKILTNSIDYLNIREENIERCNIDEIIKKIGSQSLLDRSIREIPFIHLEPLSYSLLKSTVRNEIEGKTYSRVGKASSGRDELIHRVIAHNKLRSRIQMASAYLTAEIENRALIGTINKTELMTGLITKWGHGHCTDLTPLGHLYRTEILQLAKFLDIPEMISSVSKADLLPGIENKYLYFFDLTAYEVDRILIRLELGRSIQEISEEIGLPMEKIDKINQFFISSIFLRSAPLSLKNT
ncbi:MAG: NAD(+) synthase [Candidatus Hodarchaeales archaeon]